jgi:hypothetical protein
MDRQVIAIINKITLPFLITNPRFPFDKSYQECSVFLVNIPQNKMVNCLEKAQF